MKRQFFSRTRPSRGIPGHEKNEGHKPFLLTRACAPRIFRRGSITMAVLFLTVVFTGLGLAVIHASGVHLKINGFRKFSGLLDCASENGLKRGLRDLTAWLEAEGLLAPVPAERVDAMRKEPQTAFPLLLEGALGSAFPRTLEESFDGMNWESRAECAFGGLVEMGGLRRTSGSRPPEGSPGSGRGGSRPSRVLSASWLAACPCQPSLFT
jgi:hypothetical protein